MASAIVTNLQGYSIHDGPGIRTTVFLRGCPLRCQWCANPENLSGTASVGFLQKLCQGCGRCVQACQRGAISLQLPGRIDRTRCDSCGNCVDACYYDALVRYGETRTATDVFDQVRRDKMFYQSSGGGITVSGGEPLLWADFVEELFIRCREDGISTCVETCGAVPGETVRRILPLTDHFCFDLKLMDPARHRRWTGADNGLILANAAYLARSGADLLFRQPLIPGVNDDGENLRATAAFIKSLGREDLALQLMPYHRMGLSKYQALGLPYALAETPVLTPEATAGIAAQYISLGVSCTVSK